MATKLNDDQPLLDVTHETQSESEDDEKLIQVPKATDNGENDNEQDDLPLPVDAEDDPYPDLGPQGHRRNNDGCGQCCRSCMMNCCHQCKTIDYIIFIDNVLLIVIGFAEAVIATVSKMRTHSQCYLKAEYHSDGNTDYSDEMYWCDANLYDTLITMSIAYLLVMVNWTAQLNENMWWMWIKLFLNIIGWIGKLVSGVLLLVAYFSWCASMEAAVDNQHLMDKDNKCLAAARVFDANKDEENTLAHLYTFTIASLSLALICSILWTVALVCTIIHFCDFIYRKKDQHDDQDEDEYHMEDGDDDNMNFRYPENNPENYVRHRIVRQDADQGAAADGAMAANIQEGDVDGAYVLERRDVPA